jgi:hypothetical protein
MKKLMSVFAIALFLSIPIAANADPVGYGTLSLSAEYPAVGGDLTLYYGTVTSSNFGYDIGTKAGIFCISSTQMLGTETFAFNKLDGTATQFYSNSGPISVDTVKLAEAAWIADHYNGQKEAAQVAIWAIMGMKLADGTYAVNDLGQATGAQALYNAAQNNSGYTTGNWYAAYNEQDFLTPVPEPGILILLGIAMSAIGMASWRIRKI